MAFRVRRHSSGALRWHFAVALAAVLGASCSQGHAPNDHAGDGGSIRLPDGGTFPDGSTTACESKYDCPAGDVCEVSTCGSPPPVCLGSGDCPAGEICNFSNTCEPGCSDSRDCLAPQICDTQSGVCGVCSSTNPCASGETCVAGACRSMATCQSTADCAAVSDGEVCLSGTCGPCQSDSDCAASPYETPRRVCERGLCAVPQMDGGIIRPGPDGGQGCQTKYDCSPGYVCTNGACVLPSSTCLSNADCPSGEICGISGACVPGCSGSQDCLTGDSCNLMTNMCQSGGCDTNACDQACMQSGGVCDPSTCSCTSSCDMATCTQQCAAQNQQCDPTTCMCMGSTMSGCMQNSDCGMSQVCQSGSCAEEALNPGTNSPCSLVQCLLGSFGIGAACVGSSSSMPCNCQSAFSGGFSGFNFNGPFACH